MRELEPISILAVGEAPTSFTGPNRFKKYPRFRELRSTLSPRVTVAPSRKSISGQPRIRTRFESSNPRLQQINLGNTHPSTNRYQNERIARLG